MWEGEPAKGQVTLTATTAGELSIKMKGACWASSANIKLAQ
jgi:hypothetical protein